MLEWSHLSKSFGEKVLFQDFNLQLQEKQVYILQGSNGAGKTTFLRMTAGLEKYEGTILCPSLKTMLFQENRLLENQTVLQNLSLVQANEQVVLKELESLGLESYLNTVVRKLSGGTKRKIAIVRALLVEAELVLLDEPLTGLDQESQVQFMEYILKKTKGKTVLWVSHETVVPESANFINLSLLH